MEDIKCSHQQQIKQAKASNGNKTNQFPADLISYMAKQRGSQNSTTHYASVH